MKWSDEEIRFLKDNYLTLSKEELGERLGRTKRSIEHKCSLFELRTTKRRLPINEQYFDIWSESMAYILGFTTADGCVRNKPTERRLSYGVASKDRCVLEFISNQIFGTTEPIKDTIEYRNNKPFNTSRLRINSKYLVDSLSKYGVVPRKTGSEVLPDVPEIYKKDYLRGLFDGDGHVSITNHSNNQLVFGITSASKSFLQEIKLYLGMDFGYIVKKKENCYSWAVYKQAQIAELESFMYNTNSFYLERKRRKFNRGK